MLEALEAKIISEYKADTDTFLDELHHYQVFNKEKFSDLLDSCEALIKIYQIQKSDNYIKICRYIIFLMQWILLECIYHLSPEDLSEIKNYEELLEEDHVRDSNFLNYGIDRIREISIGIIM